MADSILRVLAPETLRSQARYRNGSLTAERRYG